MIQFNPKFSIGQKVFYNLPETSPGRVIDILFRVHTGNVMYEVVFDHLQAPLQYEEHELSEQQTFS